MRAQSGFVMIFLLILILIFVVLFLVTIGSTMKNTEYTQLYSTNLLLSILRSDTGYPDPECKLVSDAIYCTFMNSEHICSGSGLSCKEVAEENVRYYLDYDNGIAKKSYKHLIIAEPDWTAIDGSGQIIRFAVGDEDLLNPRGKKTAVNEIVGSGSYILNIRLLVTES